MGAGPIFGYQFKIVVEEHDGVFIAYCPGVGGVYEEGTTREEAIEKAYKGACAILEARAKKGDWLTGDSDFLKVVRQPPQVSVRRKGRGSPDEYLATVLC